MIRFAAPAAGSYAVNVAFFGADFVGPTTTDVHVLVDGNSVFDGIVNGFGPGSGPIFSTNLNLKAGDTIDFAVGIGPNGNYLNDLTGLAATAYAGGDNKASSASGASGASGAEKMFQAMDKNKDNSISRAEAQGTPHAKDFTNLDKNNDGKLSREEHAAAPEHAGEKAAAGGTAGSSSSGSSSKKY